MNDSEDRELEVALRALPFAPPEAALRERVLRAAAARAARRSWARPLAYALCLIGLMALDMAAERVHSAHLARLTGDAGQASITVSRAGLAPAAWARREAMMVAMLEGEVIR